MTTAHVPRVAQTAPGRSQSPAAARSRPRWYVEVAIVAFFYAAYERSREAAPTHPGHALRHALDVIAVERTLHLGVETSVNRVFAAHDWLAAGGGYYYATLNFVITPAVLVWLYTRRPELFTRARTMLVLASFGALLIYVLYPVTPPRLAMPGMTDVLVAHNIFGAAHAAKSGGFVNVYAAMPSLHVGWAVWSALWISRSYPTSRWRHAAWLYPIATTLVVLGTANHYVLDAIGGLATMLIAEQLTTPRARALLATGGHLAVRPLRQPRPLRPQVRPPSTARLARVGSTQTHVDARGLRTPISRCSLTSLRHDRQCRRAS